MAEKTVAVAVPAPVDDSAARKVASFADAMQLAASVHGSVANVADTLGDGFALLDKDSKSRLVGVEMVFLDWDFHFGDYDATFCSARVVTKDGAKFRINDGGTGLCEQLRAYSAESGNQGGLYAPHGLTASTYETCVECSKPHPLRDDECGHCGDTSTRRARGTTYYIDLTA